MLRWFSNAKKDIHSRLQILGMSSVIVIPLLGATSVSLLENFQMILFQVVDRVRQKTVIFKIEKKNITALENNRSRIENYFSELVKLPFLGTKQCKRVQASSESGNFCARCKISVLSQMCPDANDKIITYSTLEINESVSSALGLLVHPV